MPEAPNTVDSPRRSTIGDTRMGDTPAAEVPYNREFEDSLMTAILEPPATDDGGIESRDMLPASQLGCDTIPHRELPLPLDDPRRQYKSIIPGVKLTHPAGLYEGGNPDQPEADAVWARQWIKQNNIKTKEDLERCQRQQIQEQIGEMQKRAQARKKALDDGENIGRELKMLKDQREIELQAQHSIIEKARAKKEERRTLRAKLSAPIDDVH